jgi:hypothetical protein
MDEDDLAGPHHVESLAGPPHLDAPDMAAASQELTIQVRPYTDLLACLDLYALIKLMPALICIV